MPDRAELVAALADLADPDLLSVVNEVLKPRQTSNKSSVQRGRDLYNEHHGRPTADDIAAKLGKGT